MSDITCVFNFNLSGKNKKLYFKTCFYFKNVTGKYVIFRESIYFYLLIIVKTPSLPTPQNHQKKRIVIFASGNGSNAENIIKHFQKNEKAEVSAVLSNKRTAQVLRRAHDLDVKAIHFDREALYDSNEVFNILKDMQPDLIVLAGFLWIFPNKILKRFPNRVINIHPALLPKFGGKGMYGMNVHKAVIEKKELETGISIHFVNDKYDEGKLIFQATVPVTSEDTAEDVAEKIHALEHKHFPVVIENLLFPSEND
jgi:phosphoribosylglycinamide formyltransferase 1